MSYVTQGHFVIHRIGRAYDSLNENWHIATKYFVTKCLVNCLLQKIVTVLNVYIPLVLVLIRDTIPLVDIIFNS